MKRVIRYYNQKAIEISNLLKNDFSKRYKGKSVYSDIIFSSLPDKKLGLFDSVSKAIFLDEDLLNDFYSYETVLNIALHELSHAISFALYGYSEHDEVFRNICKSLKVDPDFNKARININEKKTHDQKLEKIKKLISLSTSPSSEEGKAAMNKARELMEAYGIKAIEEKNISEVYEIAFKASLRFSQRDYALLSMTASLTGIFTIRAKHALMGYGSKDQVETALYLYNTLESIINAEVKKLKLKTNREINSFYHGVSSSILRSDDYLSSMIIVTTENEMLARNLVYNDSRIRRTSSSYDLDRSSYYDGSNFGKTIKIDKSKIKKTKLLT